MPLWYDSGHGWAKINVCRKNLGADVFLCCPGPSLSTLPIGGIRGPGALIVAVTTAYPTIYPDVWVGMDGPGCYDRRLWWEPFVKIARGNYSRLTCCGFPIGWGPNTMFADTEGGELEDIFRRTGPGAKFLWCKDSLGVAMHYAVWIGAKRINLVGTDLRTKEADYCHDANLTVPQRNRNARVYAQQAERLAKWAEMGEHYGVRIVSCTPDSAVNDRMDFVPLEEAISAARAHAPRSSGKALYVKEARLAADVLPVGSGQKPKMLHLNSYWLVGGTEFYILSMVKALPEYEHHLWCTTGSPDERMMGEYRSVAGVAPRLARGMSISEIVRAVNPAAVIWHNWPHSDIRGAMASLSGRVCAVVYHGCRPRMDAPGWINVAVSQDSLKSVPNPGDFIVRPGAVEMPEIQIRDPQQFVLGYYGADRPRKHAADTPEIWNAALADGGELLCVGAAAYQKQTHVPARFVPPSIWRKHRYLQEMSAAIYRNTEAEVEGFGLAIMDLMAAGVVVVAEARGGMLDQIEDGVTGFLVPWADKQGFIKKIRLLKSDPAMRNRMSAAATDFVRQRHTINHFRHRWLELLQAAEPAGATNPNTVMGNAVASWLASGDPGNGSHLAALAACLKATGGPILELGSGRWSTPALHEYCEASRRKLLTIENNKAFYERFAHMRSQVHEIRNEEPLAMATNGRWAVVLIDHCPDAERGTMLTRLADHAQFIVCHDSDGAKYGYDFSALLYRRDYPTRGPLTTVVSNVAAPPES